MGRSGILPRIAGHQRGLIKIGTRGPKLEGFLMKSVKKIHLITLGQRRGSQLITKKLLLLFKENISCNIYIPDYRNISVNYTLYKLLTQIYQIPQKCKIKDIKAPSPYTVNLPLATISKLGTLDSWQFSFSGKILNVPCEVIIDSGCMCSSIDKDFAKHI